MCITVWELPVTIQQQSQDVDFLPVASIEPIESNRYWIAGRESKEKNQEWMGTLATSKASVRIT